MNSVHPPSGERCESTRSMIALEAGGDLPAADAGRLDRHLQACAACRRFAAEMRQSQQAVALLAGAPVDEEILATIRAGVLRGVASSGRLWWGPWLHRRSARSLPLAAALVLALGAALLLWSGRTAELEAPQPRPRVAEPSSSMGRQPSPAVTPEPIAVATVFERASDATPQTGPSVTASPEILTAAAPELAVATATPAARPPVVELPAVEPMVIKLVSEESDLVIYWLVNPSIETTKETNDEISAV